jgi:hypothetical protein
VSESFVVEIKPSARRTNGAVGRLVNREGGRHDFPDRETAESWAAGLVTGGKRPVWIRAANPNDPAAVDAYLVGRTRPVGGPGGRSRRDPVDQATIGRDWDGDGPPTAVGTVRRVDREADADRQASIERYGRDPGLGTDSSDRAGREREKEG